MNQGALYFTETPGARAPGLTAPRAYTGLSGFHKYWGKKPVECFAYLIQNLTREGDVVVDPFLGSGLVAREALNGNRRFIGVDINPVSIELARFLVEPPSYTDFLNSIHFMEKNVKPVIDESYKLNEGTVASHFLWDDGRLKSVWRTGAGRRKREELEPGVHDLQQIEKYKGYKSKFIREPRFFRNSRINASPDLALNDLFTGRALRNIDLLLEYINSQPAILRRALQLTLTSASGQMSRMVFAISRRGKAGGVAVGSWVVGYWRPETHFEVNVWNCFSHRAKKIIKAIGEIGSARNFTFSADPLNVLNSKAEISLLNADARDALEALPDDSISLILADPPHGDRIPYLELSEMWNAILGREARFDREIVVSNARERGKGKDRYNAEMREFTAEAARVLKPGGFIALIFNSRDDESWEFLRGAERGNGSVIYRGCFPMRYSAGSVVQDNRRGAMKHDYVLVYEKPSRRPGSSGRRKALTDVRGWTPAFPNRT